MGGKITGLRYQKRKRDRVNVYIDGEFAFGLPAIEAARLRVGQSLTDAEIARLREVDAEARAFDDLARFLGYRPRSVAESRRYLEERGVPGAIVDRVIDRARAAGYLDDAAFARFWIENRLRFRPRGERALRHELFIKGVPPEVVDEALKRMEIDEAVAAREVLMAREAAWRRLDWPTFRQRAGALLARRGFDYDTIADVLREVWQRWADADGSSVEGSPDT